ncbi:hypothetical protein WR25_20630 isoform B [Diploscapter pachys]|uniref:G-protein coupled receptors family 1 profile domain-containing protein n=1 Tax=Diploscapter pachys TaxID=2018661 RepID=A0A2A2KZQ1_9BILA|nr:hypothetical protein WR25_20630 isoform B [Diploscapter pachys]
MSWSVLVHIQAVINGHSWSAGGGTSPAHHLTTPSTSYAAAHPEDLVFTTGASAIQTVNSTTVSLASQVFDGLLPPRLCLGLYDVFIALFLVLLILLTIFGNVLVVLSVFVYKRMRTFTNILLTSLATAGKFLCGVWATSDVLLCTASILNLCVISLDRYMAITSPLKYPRTRSRKMAAGLLSAVWATSVIICTPPWLVQGWGLFDSLNHYPSGVHQNFTCGYSASVPYRIYSALGSFYIPLFVMLSVYFKIFRVANERESLMRQSVGTCRLSNRLAKNQQEKSIRNNNYRSQTAPTGRMRVQVNNTGRINYSVRPVEYSSKLDSRFESRLDSTDMDDTSPPNGDSIEVSAATTIGVMMPHLLPSSAHFHSNHSTPVHTQHSQITDTTTHNMSASLINNSMTSPTGSQKDAVLPGNTLTPRKSMERECHSLADLCNSVQVEMK